MAKESKEIRTKHLVPIPFEAQEAQSEWLLEQFDNQLMPEDERIEYRPVWNVEDYVDGCPQPYVSITTPSYYIIPRYYDENGVGGNTSYGRDMLQLNNDDDDSHYNAAKWPVPWGNHDLDDNPTELELLLVPGLREQREQEEARYHEYRARVRVHQQAHILQQQDRRRSALEQELQSYQPRLQARRADLQVIAPSMFSQLWNEYLRAGRRVAENENSTNNEGDEH